MSIFLGNSSITSYWNEVFITTMYTTITKTKQNKQKWQNKSPSVLVQKSPLTWNFSLSFFLVDGSSSHPTPNSQSSLVSALAFPGSSAGLPKNSQSPSVSNAKPNCIQHDWLRVSFLIIKDSEHFFFCWAFSCQVLSYSRVLSAESNW